VTLFGWEDDRRPEMTENVTSGMTARSTPGQLWAQRLVTSMGELYLFTVVEELMTYPMRYRWI